MSLHSPTSAAMGAAPGYPNKRAKHSPPDTTGTKGRSPGSTEEARTEVTAATGGVKTGQSSNFRNVSACNRCRLRKNRCDQRLPSCASCEKANVKCVGYDPITKREIPRRYAPPDKLNMISSSNRSVATYSILNLESHTSNRSFRTTTSHLRLLKYWNMPLDLAQIQIPSKPPVMMGDPSMVSIPRRLYRSSHQRKWHGIRSKMSRRSSINSSRISAVFQSKVLRIRGIWARLQEYLSRGLSLRR